MSIDIATIREQEELCPHVHECISKSVGSSNALPSYQYLYQLKPSIPKEIYAYYLRTLFQMNTANVSNELRLKMLEGVDREDLMYQDELDAIKMFDDCITIYRGTSPKESVPGICWTIYKHVAEGSEFNFGRVFKAVIPKSSVIMHFAHEEAEGEIIAHVTSGYTIISGE